MRSLRLGDITCFVGANVHREQQIRLYALYLLPTAAAGMLSGCIPLPVNNLQPTLGQAQLDDPIVDDMLDQAKRSNQNTIAVEHPSIPERRSTAKPKRAKLKSIARKFFDLQLKHGIADFIGTSLNLDVSALTLKRECGMVRARLQGELSK